MWHIQSCWEVNQHTEESDSGAPGVWIKNRLEQFSSVPKNRSEGDQEFNSEYVSPDETSNADNKGVVGDSSLGSQRNKN